MDPVVHLQKNQTTFFFVLYFEIVPKKVSWGTPFTLSTPSKCFWRGWSRRDRWKKVRNLKKNQKNQKKIIKIKKKFKIGQVFFYLIYRNCPQKGAQGNAVYILSAIKVFLKRMKQKKLLKVHPPSEQRGTLILFNLIECGRLSFQVSPFLNTGIERQY